MAGRDVLDRLRVVAAIGSTVVVLAGVAAGMMLAQSFWGLTSGTIISLGFFASWYFFDTVLWVRRSGYLRTLLLAIGISIPCVTLSIAALISNVQDWDGFLVAAAVVLSSWGLLALIFWITRGFRVESRVEEKEGDQ